VVAGVVVNSEAGADLLVQATPLVIWDGRGDPADIHRPPKTRTFGFIWYSS
jgi:hypothetical protein